MTNSASSFIPVCVVTFGHASEVIRCLQALRHVGSATKLEIFICENGGSAAFDRLIDSLTCSDGPCCRDPRPPMATSLRLVQTQRLRLRNTNPASPVGVHVGAARDNLGYAGGVNAWLDPLLGVTGWLGCWILNPDTEPEPQALNELVSYAARHGRDMVGSRLSPQGQPDVVHSRGLAWRKWRAATRSVDLRAPAAINLPPDDVDPRLDSPSGASIYVTRACIERIGLMDERYFLYFEDLDWGLKAKRQGVVGYAHLSVVPHTGGTTIGTSTSRRRQSPLAVYLDFRNRLLFVGRHFPQWLPWTFLAESVDLLLYARARAFRNLVAAARGMGAGLIGRTGRPDHMLRAHRATTGTKPS